MHTMPMRDRSERGATAIEVALILGLIVMVVMGAMKLMGARSAVGLDRTGTAIDEAEANTDPNGDSGGGGGGGGGSVGVTTTTPVDEDNWPDGEGPPSGGGGDEEDQVPSTTTTTTAPPTTTTTTTTTTTPPTTTTTAPPTTTTTTTTTTIPAPTTASATLHSLVTYDSGYRIWSARSRISVTGNTGGPIAGAQVLLYTYVYHTQYGWQGQANWYTTNSDGEIDLNFGPYDNYGSYRYTRIYLQINRVIPPGPIDWDGGQPSQVEWAPYE